MSESIPDDVMKVASGIVTDICVKRGQMIGFRDMENEYLERAIASAVLIERERCANVALAEYEKRFENVGGYPAARVHDFIVVARAIEKGIRRGLTADTKTEA